VRDRRNNPVSSSSLPRGTVLRNGVVDSLPAVSVAQLPDLSYRAQFTVPQGYAVGDAVALSLTAEHPPGSLLTRSQDVGSVLPSGSKMFGTLSRMLQVKVGGVPVVPPVGAFSVTPIIDGVDRNDIFVSLSTVPGGYYVSFSIGSVDASASVHIRVRVNTSAISIIDTFRMERTVEESDPLVLSQQNVRLGRRRPRLRVAR